MDLLLYRVLPSTLNDTLSVRNSKIGAPVAYMHLGMNVKRSQRQQEAPAEEEQESTTQPPVITRKVKVAGYFKGGGGSMVCVR